MPHNVFISYVREDTAQVVELYNALRSNGVTVWLDQYDIPPGARWKEEIRNAIRQGEFFIACFSPNYIKRGATYMNEELTLAIEQLRQMPSTRTWFIPVMLADCTIPDREIGGGARLLDLQQVHLHKDWDDGLTRIISVVKPSPTATTDTAKSPEITVLYLADSSDGARLRVDQELREIQTEMRRTATADRFRMEVRWAARPADLARAIIETSPTILHFAGRGESRDELMLEDSRGRYNPLNISALAGLLSAIEHKIECIIFNRFYSLDMAKFLRDQANYVIGFPAKMGDRAAIEFSRAFYSALGSGYPIREAFRFGLIAIRLIGHPENSLPVLLGPTSD